MHVWDKERKNFLFIISIQLKYNPLQTKGVDKLLIHNKNLFEYTPLEGRGAKFLIYNV